MGLRIALVVKPPADDARLDELRRVVESLRAAGHQVRARLTFERDDACRFARRAARSRCDLVVAAGGDGTINEVVNGLATSSWQPRLGVVPFGTANDFATGLGIPADPGAALAVAVTGKVVEADVGVVNERCFINVSTGGFGAEATKQVPAHRKRALGRFAYVLAGARRLLRWAPSRASFRADGRLIHEGRFVFFAVGNGRRTGGGTRVTPRAEFGDGRLDVTVVGDVSRLDFLSLLPDLRAGTHLESPDVLYLRAQRLEVAAAAPLAVNADGEALQGSRFEYRLLPRPLSLMVPWQAR